MAFIVRYTDRGGRPQRVVFGSKESAQAYAKSVRGARIEENGGGGDAPPSVRATRVGSREEVERERRRTAEMSERGAEAYFEAGSQARLYGASSSEALDEAAHARRSVYRESAGAPGDHACAGGCGRTVRGGYTMCRRCAK